MSSGRESPILVFVAEGAALVWSARDSRRLREELRLCGSPVGALVRQPRQNGRLGLPLRLLPEEARYLAESGQGLLLRRHAGSQLPEGVGAAAPHHETLRRSHAEQRQLALQEKRRLLQALGERIRHGREAKRKRRQEGGEG
ncbi:tRNA-splicing endonuclease subunit Sen34 isoform X2 [Chiloscyllium plagiosum]|uniref:tRNA-splicing endonuclease subunit Sen34 isoform X2 n=1 Tax=Chiloscyllium plagiosum TaxID=36176 RepID=UPI001CB87EF1|nr:tRNA-splicing endonuclease subunit Sen34 isoform X2 [Chiloscyllium plagiosum]